MVLLSNAAAGVPGYAGSPARAVLLAAMYRSCSAGWHQIAGRGWRCDEPGRAGTVGPAESGKSHDDHICNRSCSSMVQANAANCTPVWRNRQQNKHGDADHVRAVARENCRTNQSHDTGRVEGRRSSRSNTAGLPTGRAAVD